ncbi:hypothetical protein T4D_14707 [Trichinella pseudospiralis]|uniref:Uncharacterized protein n=1 Tax=Trichinella pseudospiralis TaxID=6337 RepID=A0A0V1FPJ1_TRIPS|nr:hypothetical protein T4D_14707 [Trichinella pseudospiralis]
MIYCVIQRLASKIVKLIHRPSDSSVGRAVDCSDSSEIHRSLVQIRLGGIFLSSASSYLLYYLNLNRSFAVQLDYLKLTIHPVLISLTFCGVKEPAI